MNDPENHAEGDSGKNGLIGYFDLLGYKSIIQSNQIKEVIQKIRSILQVCRTSKKLNEGMEYLFDDHICEHVIFSDTILIYSNTLIPPAPSLFTLFCATLVNGLFWEGFPVRGALAAGDFYVESRQGKICLAGAPIVEAHELTECLDFAGCVVAPSAELILNPKLDYFLYEVPIKGHQKQKMFVLNANACCDESRGFSRQVVLDKFGAHNKRIGVEVLPKINNTITFFEACKREVTSQLEAG